MPSPFRAETFQNEFLPAGTREVHAIVTVTATDELVPQAVHGERVFAILCDVSGSMEGAKLQAAKDAMVRLVTMLPADCRFFLIAGADGATLVCPPMLADGTGKQYAAQAIGQMRAFGGTRMSNWLHLALEQFRGRNGLLQAVLLTDGQNDSGDQGPLASVLASCEGVFQCDCRGVGTDWQVEQLRQVSQALLGSVDLIASPQRIEADFQDLLTTALAKTVSQVTLRLWTPRGATVQFCKEVSPQLNDLTGRARELQPQVREYPTGAWAKGEARDYHLCLEVQPGKTGDEMLAGRASVIQTVRGQESKVAETRVLAVWTDDEAKSAKIDRVVAHYTGQAELAQSIQDGMEARARGDATQATTLLGRAVQLAHASGNEATAKLLRGVVEVQDASQGTVRLRTGVAKEDSMALETRSTKTTRLVSK